MGWTSYDDQQTDYLAGKTERYQIFKTSLAVTGVAGSWYSAWLWTGTPPAGDVGGGIGSLTSTQCYASTTGSLNFPGSAVAPDTKHLLTTQMTCGAATAVPGIIMVYDRLLYYPGIICSITTEQAFTNSIGLPRYTDGDQVMAWLEMTSPGSPSTTLGYGLASFSYTNQSGTPNNVNDQEIRLYSRSEIGRIPHTATTTGYWNPFLPLNGTDAGILSVSSITLTATMSSVCALVLGRVLGVMPLPTAGVTSERDWMFQVCNLARQYDGACIGMLVYEPGALAASTIYSGHYETAWG